jgi:hypothetical protein
MTPGEFQHDQIDKSGIILKLIYQSAINLYGKGHYLGSVTHMIFRSHTPRHR